MTKTRMLHNIAAWIGFKWILWKDLGNRKWYIKLGNSKQYRQSIRQNLWEYSRSDGTKFEKLVSWKGE